MQGICKRLISTADIVISLWLMRIPPFPIHLSSLTCIWQKPTCPGEYALGCYVYVWTCEIICWHSYIQQFDVGVFDNLQHSISGIGAQYVRCQIDTHSFFFFKAQEWYLTRNIIQLKFIVRITTFTIWPYRAKFFIIDSSEFEERNKWETLSAGYANFKQLKWSNRSCKLV